MSVLQSIPPRVSTPSEKSVPFSRSRRQRRRGDYNYLGWAIVAGLGALAVAAVASQGVTGRANSKTDDYYIEILQLAEQFRSRYPSDYTVFSTSISTSGPLLASLRMVAADKMANGNAVTPWGGVLQAAGLTTTTFEIEVLNTSLTPSPPVGTCTFILDKLSNSTGVVDFGSIGGSTLGNSSITHDQATTLCSGASGAYVVME